MRRSGPTTKVRVARDRGATVRFEPAEGSVGFSLLEHGRDVLRNRSRPALSNKTLKTELASGLPEFLGFNKARTSAPGYRYEKAEELYWSESSLGIGDMQATIFSIRAGNNPPAIQSGQSRDEAVKEQGARRKEDTNRDNNAAVAYKQRNKCPRHDENRHSIELTIRVPAF